MKYALAFTPTYEKHFKKLSPIEKKRTIQKLRLLMADPAHPSLRAKKIKGQNQLWECSVDMDIRIIWQYKDNALILALDIGHHDILKKF